MQCTADQFHLGNYFGAIKPMIELSENQDNEMFLMLVNMHSYTSVQDGDQLRHNALNTIRLYMASVKNMNRFFIYNQADVPALTQLTRVFSCLINMGTMDRMHAFKDKVAKGKANAANVGLFTYPILMAADILMFDADIVPVGKDQKQHVELARDLANKFNRLY